MKLSGVLPPIATPFQDGKLAIDKLKKNFQKWNQTGLSGFLVLGSNGEAVFLNEKEKMKMMEVSRQAIPKSKIMKRIIPHVIIAPAFVGIFSSIPLNQG